MHPLRYLLFPLSQLYKWATNLRNYLYDIGHKRSFHFEVPVVAVGNLNLGGSGKTPMIEYLIRLLKSNYKLATLSRGYGRKTRGIRFAKDDDTARSVGDEPYLLHKNFGNEVIVVVGEDRAMSIPSILHEQPDVKVVLLDDAFQHRSVNPHLNILLTRYSRPFFNDHVLPLGYLREPRKSTSRADVIIVTKCPNGLSDEEKGGIRKNIRKYSGDKPIFFSCISYETPIPFSHAIVPVLNKIVLLSGIANPKPFIEFASSRFSVQRHFQFSDHHEFKEEEIVQIRDYILKQGQGVALLTTEKDSVRLRDQWVSLLRNLPCYYVPIKMTFCESGAEFDAMVNHVVEKNTSFNQST